MYVGSKWVTGNLLSIIFCMNKEFIHTPLIFSIVILELEQLVFLVCGCMFNRQSVHISKVSVENR